MKQSAINTVNAEDRRSVKGKSMHLSEPSYPRTPLGVWSAAEQALWTVFLSWLLR